MQSPIPNKALCAVISFRVKLFVLVALLHCSGITPALYAQVGDTSATYLEVRMTKDDMRSLLKKKKKKSGKRKAPGFLKRIDPTLTTYEITDIDRQGIFDTLHHAVTVYKLRYFTAYQGKTVEASGLVMVPKTDSTLLPVLLYHHGTVPPIVRKYAPSAFKWSTKKSRRNIPGEFGYALRLASEGFAVVMPDYLGYGASAAFDHPYTLHEINARTSIDMLKASRKVLALEGKGGQPGIFIMGISEGAAVGMAAHRLLDTDPVLGEHVRASSLLAGPYNFESTVEWYLNGGEVSAFANSLYMWSCWSMLMATRPDLLEQTFTRQYKSQKSFFSVCNYLFRSKKPEKRLTKAAYRELKYSKTGELWDVLIAQSIDVWQSNGKIMLYHGKDDIMVPWDNSLSIYRRMGKQNTDMQLITLEGRGHLSANRPYFYRSLYAFEKILEVQE